MTSSAPNPPTDRILLHPEVVDAVINSPFSRHLDPKDIHQLALGMRLIHLPAGSVIFAEESPGDFFSYICEGRVAIRKQTPEGNEKLLAILYPGRLIGEMEVLDAEPRIAAAHALTSVKLLEMSRHTLRGFIEETPLVGISILKAIVRKLSADLHRMDAHITMLGPDSHL